MIITLFVCYNQVKLLTGKLFLETLKLFALSLKISILRALQQIRILPFYFQEPLWKIDLLYFKSYLRVNPYKACKQHFKKEPREVQYSYGETWVSTVPKLIQYLPITSRDVLFDLGSGIGRVSFWFQKISGCEVVAIEKVSLFVQKANQIKKKLGQNNITFLEEDILEVDYSRATLIYFYGTSFSDLFIQKLIEKWKPLKPGVRILTTSFHLNEYLKEPEYKVTQQYKVSYPWGLCDLYLQEKI